MVPDTHFEKGKGEFKRASTPGGSKQATDRAQTHSSNEERHGFNIVVCTAEL